MILGTSGTQTSDSRTTLDDLFRRAAVRRPDAMALCDPPNRAAVTGTPARTLTYAQADRAIWALAARLRELGLQTDAVIALHLPNTVESVLAVLGVLRAGMVAMPLPLLWRKAEITAALSAGDVKMLMTCTRIGGEPHDDICLAAASEVFSISHVGAFGADPADGVVPLDDIFDTAHIGIAPTVLRSGNPAAHAALITWEATPAGPRALPRNHQHLLAGGLAVYLEGDIQSEAAILSTISTTSFAGFSCAVLPWLLCGGSLALHHPFDAATFCKQREALAGGVVIVPGPLRARALEGNKANIALTVGVWRGGERRAATSELASSQLDVTTFGELGLIAGRGSAAVLPKGIVHAPQASATGVPVIETARTGAGTLALRGGMVPADAYGAATVSIGADGFIDTLYPCQIDARTSGLTITGVPPGTVAVGGYRFSQSRLEQLVARLDEAAVIVALPDAVLSQRLVGRAPDAAAMQTALATHNPLISGAFRGRTAPAV